MNIYFLQFYGKINRIVKSYPTLTGYDPFVIQEIGALDATNFPYNDGIDAFETYNFVTSKMPDYAIIVADNGAVTSRWFVTETKYKRNGQYRVSFRRDVLSDFREEILNATVLIEKATVSDNDPAIYNQEQATFNIIKKSETLLKDKSKGAWLVGYLSSDNSANKKYEASTSEQIQITVSGISNWEYYQFVNGDFVGSPRNISYNVKCKGNNSNEGRWLCQFSFNTEGAAETDTETPAMGYKQLFTGDYAWDFDQQYEQMPVTYESKVRGVSGYTWSMSEIFQSIIANLGSYYNLDSLFAQQIQTVHTAEEEGAIKGLDGVLILDSSTSKTYKVTVEQQSLDHMARYAPNKNTSLYNRIAELMGSTEKTNHYTPTNTNDVYVKYYANHYRLILTEIENEAVEVSITANRRILNDAPYTMFAIPFHETNFNYGSGTIYGSDPAASLAIARQISLDLMSSGALYDLQLLPYCPRQDLIKTHFIDLRSSVAEANKDYELITDTNNQAKSFVLFCKESSFTFDISKSIEITEKKIQNQTDMWRLCSPNYNGLFEFNAAKNNGVNYFNVDCTYRPYNPYIHINPNFKELYGNDYDDARGLICSGDFSMPACTNKWLEYEAQNKNYQNSFDRSIQHMEVEQKYQRINQIAGAIAGAGVGGVAGSAYGIGGAIAGSAISAAGGIADIIMGEQLRSEQIRYAKDQFAFNLENIKAIPNSLAKVSAFNKNNKIFPFLEYYSCTDIEKEAFRNILKYDGMTVNRIGRIIDYLRENELQYIRARLIRCEELHDDQHIVDVIANEMEKGAYYDTRSD